ncbi:hypothetical protein AO498_16725 [Algoriphagus sanaruensis]|uniref:Uncharacterized protein n=1 Tax=Algoriphagus sanaruensis TaxID=1727163 RepID=A0A142ESJ0_9BACT|nr:hypothetical protein AO498_16725 [Algoriphagus sanaruensis]
MKIERNGYDLFLLSCFFRSRTQQIYFLVLLSAFGKEAEIKKTKKEAIHRMTSFLKYHFFTIE